MSFFIKEDSPEEEKQIIKLEKSDILQLEILLAMKLVSSADALHLLKTSTLVSANIAVLKNSNVQTLASQFLDSDAVEGKLAAEIITIVQSEGTEVPVVIHLTPSELLEDLIPHLRASNKTTADVDMKSCIHICQKLQSLEELLKTNTAQLLLLISEPVLEKATRELSLYVKLHLTGRARSSNARVV